MADRQPPAHAAARESCTGRLERLHRLGEAEQHEIDPGLEADARVAERPGAGLGRLGLGRDEGRGRRPLARPPAGGARPDRGRARPPGRTAGRSLGRGRRSGVASVIGRSRRRQPGAVLGDPARQVGGAVGDDDVGAGPGDRDDALGEHPAPIDPAPLPGRGDHRVLAADLVGGDRQVEPGAGRDDVVEAGQARLDQQDVRPFGHVLRELAERLATVGRIHLVAAPVAERRGAVGRLAERPVERGGGLGRVGHDRGVGAPRPIERRPDGRHLAVHHRRGRHDVRPGLGLAHGGRGQPLERGVVVDRAVAGQRSAMAVVGVLAQARVGDRDERDLEVAQATQGLLHDAVRRPRTRPVRVLGIGQAEQQHAADAQLGQGERVADGLVGRHALDPGKRVDRLADVATGADEHRRDEHRGIETRLAHEGPQRGRPSQPAGAGGERGRRRSGRQVDGHLVAPMVASAARVASATAPGPGAADWARTVSPRSSAWVAVVGPMATRGTPRIASSAPIARARSSHPRTADALVTTAASTPSASAAASPGRDDAGASSVR